MKTSLLNDFLIVTAILLAGANFYLHSTPAEAKARQISETRAAPVVQSSAFESPQIKPAPATSAIHWAPLEADEYPQYMSNLRNFGFPEELIREMIIGEINALYAPRIDPLKPKPVPHDAPMSERRRQPTPQDIVRLREWQKIEIEKQQHLESLLGVHVPREMIRTPISRNFEGSEYAISLLPPEKQEAARIIFENTWIKDDENQSVPESELIKRTGFKSEMEAYKAAVEEAHAAFKQFLTPEEFEQLSLNTTPPGTELQREIIGMEATDKELLGIFRITDEYWRNTGAVYGRWRANPVPQDQIAQYGREAETQVEQLLGPDRYTDYRMSRTDTGRQLNNLAARYDVTRDNIRQAYAAQSELDKFNSKIPGDPHPDWDQRKAELNQKLEELLGPHVFEAWQSGRNQKYRIEP